MFRIAALLLLVGSLAHADENRVFLLDLTVTAEIGLYDDSAADPFSIAPDLSLSAEGVPQIEIIHSSFATTGFHGIPLGTSFCVSGDNCGDAYHNGGIQLTYALKTHGAAGGTQDISQTAIAVFGGLLADNFDDPFRASAKLGLRASFVTTGFLQLQLAPNIHVPLNDRSTRNEQLYVPFTLTIPSQPFSAQLETGVAFPFSHIDETFQIPAGVNLIYASTDSASVFASVSFPALLAGDTFEPHGLDARVLTVGLRWSKFLGE